MPTPLQQIRLFRGLSQSQLAQSLGVHVRTVGRWEQGSEIPNARQRLELDAVLGPSDAERRRLAAWAWGAP